MSVKILTCQRFISAMGECFGEDVGQHLVSIILREYVSNPNYSEVDALEIIKQASTDEVESSLNTLKLSTLLLGFIRSLEGIKHDPGLSTFQVTNTGIKYNGN